MTMHLPPKKGAIYTATKLVAGVRFFIEDVDFVEDDEENDGDAGFFLVTVVEEANKDDMSALSIELDPDEWLSFIEEHGLVEKSQA